jgi:hypothetical protein
MSGGVGNNILKTGMVENMGVAVEIALPALSVQKLFPLPVSISGFFIDISSSGYRPTSGGVGSVISKSSMVENVVVAADITSPALSVQI